MAQRLWLLLAVISSHVAPTIAADAQTNASEISEGFIEIRINKTQHNDFYRVMLDAEERPYLDVVEVSERWLDMQSHCDFQRRRCELYRKTDGGLFWIDGEAGWLGDEQQERRFKSQNLIVADDRLWLRYDLWQQWLNITATWTLQNYTLQFQPNFPLLSTLKKQRADNRRRFVELRRQREYQRKLESQYPQEAYSVSSRYRGRGLIDKDEAQLGFDYDVLADVWQGTLVVGGQPMLASRSQQAVNYWRFRRLGLANVEQIEVGHSYIDRTSLLPGLSLKNTLKLNKHRRIEAEGYFDYQDRVEPGTEIDVYRNGFLEQTLISDESGIFRIEDLFVSGGDSVRLRFYFENGETEDRHFQIAPDNAMALERHTINWNLITGEIEDGQRLSHGRLRAGLTSRLSGGIQWFALANEKVLPGLDLNWRLHRGANLYIETLHHERGNDLDARSNITLWPRQHLELRYRVLSAASPLLALSPKYMGGRLAGLRHSLRLGRWNIHSDLQRLNNDGNDATFRFDHHYNRELSLFYQVEAGDTEAKGRYQAHRLGGVYNHMPHHFIELSNRRTSGTSEISLLYRLKGGTASPWDAVANVNASAFDDINFIASFGYRVNRRFNLRLQTSEDYIGLELIWADIVGKSPGPSDWESFYSGTLYGKVLLPQKEDNTPIPLAGARIRANSRVAETDEQGEYTIVGLPTDQPIIVQVEQNSLDASLIAEQPAHKFELRPGTRIEFSPSLSWTSGIDGFIINTQLLERSESMHLIRVTDGQERPGVIEEDGFFMFEGLTSGEYRLEIHLKDGSVESKFITLDHDTDWLSGIEWR